MGARTCRYTTNSEENCTGRQKFILAAKVDIAEALAANHFTYASEYVETNKIAQKRQ